ncbi:MAG TPA: tetratricopeptide repeat protein [Myxococcota bacterium]|nr:tetratricopeptide repeat protein [Myxococcota bacterium]
MTADPTAIFTPVLIAIYFFAFVLRRHRLPQRKAAPLSPPQATPRPVPKTPKELEAAIAIEEGKPKSVHLAILLHRLSQLRAQEGCLLQAERIADRVSQLLHELPEIGQQDSLAASEHHVALLRALGRTMDAERIQRLIVERVVQSAGNPTLAPARARLTLAALLNVSGRFAEAGQLLRKGLEDCDAALRCADPPTASAVSGVLGDLAFRFFEQGAYADADRTFRRKLEIDRQRLGENCPELVQTLDALARLAVIQRRPEEARSYLERALRLLDEARGRLHPEVAVVARKLGTLLLESGSFTEAEDLLLRNLEIQQHSLGSEHIELVGPLRMLANLHRLQGRLHDAERRLREILALLEHARGSEHPDLVRPLDDLADLLVTQLRFADAEAALQRALKIARLHLTPEHPLITEVLDGLARLAARHGRVQESEAFLAEALEHRGNILGKDHPELAFRLIGLADAQTAQAKPLAVERLLQRSLHILETRFGPDHSQLVGVLQRLSAVLFQRRDFAGALKYLERALAIAESALEPSNPALLQLVDSQTILFEQLGRRAEADHNRDRAKLLRDARMKRETIN